MNREIIEQNEIEAVEQVIKNKIYIIRGQKVMLDSDLAELYGVTTKRLNEQIKRNKARFPSDFMFEVTELEYVNLRSQFATSSLGYGGRRYLPYAFTDFGVAMLSSVLNSDKAIQMNIFIIRVFIKMKEWILSNKDLEIKVEKLEKRQDEQGNIIKTLNRTVGQLIREPEEERGRIGFNT